MKKTALCVSILLLLLLPACGSAEVETDGRFIDLYYLNRDETGLVKEAYLLESTDMRGQTEEIIEQMKTVPERVELGVPIGTRFGVEGTIIAENQVTLDVDEHYREMPASLEVLVRASIVKNLSQVEGISYVNLLVKGEPLADNLGQAVGAMSADMFIDNEGDQINAYENVELRLFFANEAGDGLVEMLRTVEYSSNISMEKLIVEQIIAGPGADYGYPTINPATKINNVTVKDGICYVNLDEAFLTQLYNVTADVTIYSLANSLAELANVNKIQISINADSDIVYRETYNLTTIFERNLGLVK